MRCLLVLSAACVIFLREIRVILFAAMLPFLRRWNPDQFDARWAIEQITAAFEEG